MRTVRVEARLTSVHPGFAQNALRQEIVWIDGRDDELNLERIRPLGEERANGFRRLAAAPAITAQRVLYLGLDLVIGVDQTAETDHRTPFLSNNLGHAIASLRALYWDDLNPLFTVLKAQRLLVSDELHGEGIAVHGVHRFGVSLVDVPANEAFCLKNLQRMSAGVHGVGYRRSIDFL